MYIEFGTLLGMTMREVREDGDGLLFVTDSGRRFRLYHEQDCCETVYIEDIAGDLADLVGSPLTMAEEVSNVDEPPPPSECAYGPPESYTWTFYKLATVKGYVTVRFFGSSNGYYGESASLVELV